MLHQLRSPCPCPLTSLVQFARGALPLPLPKLQTSGQMFCLLKETDVLD